MLAGVMIASACTTFFCATAAFPPSIACLATEHECFFLPTYETTGLMPASNPLWDLPVPQKTSGCHAASLTFRLAELLLSFCTAH